MKRNSETTYRQQVMPTEWMSGCLGLCLCPITCKMQMQQQLSLCGTFDYSAWINIDHERLLLVVRMMMMMLRQQWRTVQTAAVYGTAAGDDDGELVLRTVPSLLVGHVDFHRASHPTADVPFTLFFLQVQRMKWSVAELVFNWRTMAVTDGVRILLCCSRCVVLCAVCTVE